MQGAQQKQATEKKRCVDTFYGKLHFFFICLKMHASGDNYTESIWSTAIFIASLTLIGSRMNLIRRTSKVFFFHLFWLHRIKKKHKKHRIWLFRECAGHKCNIINMHIGRCTWRWKMDITVLIRWNYNCESVLQRSLLQTGDLLESWYNISTHTIKTSIRYSHQKLRITFLWKLLTLQ